MRKLIARRGFGVLAVTLAALVAILGSSGVAHASRSESKDTDAAVRALKRQYEYVNAGQWDLQYRELHPAQQALLTSDEYVACSERLFEVGASVEVGKIRKVYKTTAEIPGTDVRAHMLAITYEAEGRDSAGAESQSVTTTSREVKVRDHWRWVMKGRALRACLDGEAAGA